MLWLQIRGISLLVDLKIFFGVGASLVLLSDLIQFSLLALWYFVAS